MRNERRTSGSGVGAVETGAGNRASAPRPHLHLYETLTRHLYAWNGKGSGPSYHSVLVEVAVIVAETPLDDPVADQYALIERHQPRDNVMDGHTLWFRMVTRRRKVVADEG